MREPSSGLPGDRVFWLSVLFLVCYYGISNIASFSWVCLFGSKELTEEVKDYSKKIIIILTILQAMQKRKSVRINILRAVLATA